MFVPLLFEYFYMAEFGCADRWISKLAIIIILVSYQLVNGSDEKKRNCLKQDNVWCAAKILFNCGNLFNSGYIYLLTWVGSALCLLLLGKKYQSVVSLNGWQSILSAMAGEKLFIPQGQFCDLLIMKYTGYINYSHERVCAT